MLQYYENINYSLLLMFTLYVRNGRRVHTAGFSGVKHVCCVCHPFTTPLPLCLDMLIVRHHNSEAGIVLL